MSQVYGELTCPSCGLTSIYFFDTWNGWIVDGCYRCHQRDLRTATAEESEAMNRSSRFLSHCNRCGSVQEAIWDTVEDPNKLMSNCENCGADDLAKTSAYEARLFLTKASRDVEDRFWSTFKNKSPEWAGDIAEYIEEMKHEKYRSVPDDSLCLDCGNEQIVYWDEVEIPKQALVGCGHCGSRNFVDPNLGEIARFLEDASEEAVSRYELTSGGLDPFIRDDFIRDERKARRRTD